MKKILLLIIFGINLNMSSQNKFNITFNQGYGQKPTYTQIDDNNAISQEKAESLFNFLKDSTGLEFRYSYGGCEDRAHAMSLFLKSKKIKTSKIWNFDPYYISLFNSQEQLSSFDRSGLSEKVFWGYHVAPIIKVKSGDHIELKVIDPSISDNILTIDKWLELQGAPNSYYTFTDLEWFSFVTINGWNFNNQPIPKGFPTLLTGDFYKNEGENLQKQLVEEGLAVNKIAMIIKENIVNNKAIKEEKREKHKSLLINIDNLTNALNKVSDNPFTTEVDKLEFTNYQTQFKEIKKAWKQKLDLLRTQF